MNHNKVKLAGSERQPIGTRDRRSTQDKEMIEISVILKPKTRAAAPRGGGATVSHEEFAAKHGADSGAIEKEKLFATANNLTVGEVSAEGRTVKLEENRSRTCVRRLR